ncbi:blue-light-activated histidine kinase 2 [Abditibacteriota bacterium]|nr:blue-light-activated histidine kinase 2 [Abditibacteriota bacterium]
MDALLAEDSSLELALARRELARMRAELDQVRRELEHARENGHRTSELLERERAHFHSVFEGIGEGLIITDLEDRVMYANERMLKMCGFSREEMMGRPAYEVLLPPDEWPELRGRNERRAQGHADVYETQLQRKNGARFWTLIHATPLRDPAGNIVGTIGAQLDITKRKNAEFALQQSEHRLRGIIEHAVDGFIVHDFDGNLLEVNAQICNSLGFSRDELLTMNVRDFELNFRDAEVLQKWQNVRNGERVTVNGRQKRRDGSSFPVEVRIGVVEWSGSEAMLALVRDVSERERLERELRDALLERRLIMDAVPDVLFRLDLEGHLVAWNRELEQVTGCTPEILSNRPATAFFEKPHHGPIMDAVVRSLRGEQVEVSAPLLHANGTTTPFSFAAVPLRDEKGTLLGLVGTGRDITEHLKAEEQTLLSLREKEVLLKEIHHRVKNNLQIINSLLSMQADALGDDRVKAAFSESQNRIRAMALIHETLYSAGDLGRIDVRAYCNRLTSALVRGYGASVPGVSLHLDVPEGLFLPLDAAVPCGLIINELVTNSLKYAFPGERSGAISIAVELEGEDHWVLRVADDGVGMPAVNVSTIGSTGLQLVTGLCDQLESNYRVTSTNGTQWTIPFITA